MATLRALDGPEPLERFVSLTKQIRTLENERDGLKDIIVEALQHEPADGPAGAQFVDFDGLHLELCHRARWRYSTAVAGLEADLRALKTQERANGNAELQGQLAYVKATVNRAGSETQAREAKASGIARYAMQEGLEMGALASMDQAQRDALARKAGQRSPSEKTWAVVLKKLERRRAA